MALALGLTGVPVVASAGLNEASLLVAATVARHASVQVLAQPLSVLVTAADIGRGYVDAIGLTRLVVHSNTHDGYMLMFENQGDFLRQALVKGLDSDVQLSASGGGVAQRAPGRGMRKNVLELGFRFVLSDSARQGVYAWPLRLSVTPL